MGLITDTKNSISTVLKTGTVTINAVAKCVQELAEVSGAYVHQVNLNMKESQKYERQVSSIKAEQEATGTINDTIDAVAKTVLTSNYGTDEVLFGTVINTSHAQLKAEYTYIKSVIISELINNPNSKISIFANVNAFINKHSALLLELNTAINGNVFSSGSNTLVDRIYANRLPQTNKADLLNDLNNHVQTVQQPVTVNQNQEPEKKTNNNSFNALLNQVNK